MKKFLFIIIFLNIFFLFFAELKKFDSVDFKFMNKAEGSRIIQENDEFLKEMGGTDFMLRTKAKNILEMKREAFIEFIGKQTLDWNKKETERINGLLKEIESKMKNYNLMFPSIVGFIKTTGKEEGDAAYTRSNNIILSVKELKKNDLDLSLLITHELFHIYSKNNPDMQEKLFKIIGFFKANTLQLPYNNNLWMMKITNPDAPVNNYYFNAKIRGEEYKVMPLLIINKNYTPNYTGSMFDFIALIFLPVELKEQSTELYTDENKKIKVFNINSIENYFEKVGENTDYIIHPEEIMADNFMKFIFKDNKIKTKRIFEEMEKIFSEKK